MYLVTDGGIKFFDDDHNPITLDDALATVRRIAAHVEAIGNEPERDIDATAPMDRGAKPAIAGTVDTRSES